MSESATTAIVALPATAMTSDDLRVLQDARDHLEHPSLAARLTNLVGVPIERGLGLLPLRWKQAAKEATRSVLMRILDTSFRSLDATPLGANTLAVHKLTVAGTGALSGLFGLPAVLAELPVATAIILHAIADMARREGEDLSQPEARAACIEVFALGGRSHEDDSTETGYYAVRLMLAAHLSRVPEYVLSKGIVMRGHPALVELVAAIAARFGVVVTESAAVRLVPVLGALSGALVNVVFMQHFQDMAKAHFTVRRLERKYGAEAVRAAYDGLGASATS